MTAKCLPLLIATAALLVACAPPAERAAGYVENARALFEEGDYVHAELEAKNALQIQPKNVQVRLLLADIAEKDKDFRKAAGHLLAAIESDPDLVEARTRLGFYYFLARAEEQAEEQAAAAMKIAPEDPGVRLLNARVIYLNGHIEAAIAETQYALALDPADVSAMIFLSGLHAETGDIDEAFAILDAGLDRMPAEKDQVLYQYRLRLLAMMERFDEVEAELESLANEFPDQTVYKEALIQYYMQQERPEDALTIMKQLIAENPEDMNRKIDLVKLLAILERTDEAEQRLKEYIDAAPEEYQLYLLLASLHEKQQRMDDARAVYEDLAATDPIGASGLRARNRLAILAIKDNELTDARARVESTLADVPDDSLALMMRAAFSYSDGDYDAVISDVRVVLRKDETSERALLMLARAYVRTGNGVLAQDTYRHLLALNPKHSDASQELAILLANQGDMAAAQAILQARLDVEPEDTVAASGLIQAMLAQEDLEGAEAEARKLLELNENNALAQLQLGRVLQAQGSSEDAIAAYKATLEEDPQATAALAGLIDVLMRNERSNEAVDYLLGYRESYPDVPEAQMLLGTVYAQQKKYDLAEQEFEALIKAQPQETRAYEFLAMLTPVDSAEREVIYRRGLEANPADPKLGLLLASQYDRQQRIEEAIDIYESQVEANPDNLIPVNNLASLLLDYRDDQASYEKALELAKILESKDQTELFLDTIGWAYYRNGDYASAVRYLERAVAKSKPVPMLHYYLGMAYAANNNALGAKQELNQALETEAEYPGIDEARAKLAELNAS